MTGPLTMKTLVLLIGLTGAAFSWAPQPVQDTPEVAAAKAAHLAALAKAKQEGIQKSRPQTQQNWNVEENAIKQEAWKSQWSGNNGLDQWNQVTDDTSQKEDDGSWKDDGSWLNYDDGSWRESDTTEAPKVENKWASVGEPTKWKGPIALPPGYDESGAPLPVEDTPEVAAAKAKHLQAYVRAAAKTGPAALAIPVPSQRPTATQLRSALPNSLVGVGSQKSHVHSARPSLLQAQRVVPKEPAPIYEHEGVAETPEVAAAKAAHFAAHAKRRLQ